MVARNRTTWTRVDFGIAVALLGATVTVFALLPNALGDADEAYFLLHTRRILSGQVIYRDFIEQYTPLGYYLMAIPFALFGANVVTAKFTMAMFHGGTTLLLFGAARRLGVGRGLAAAAGLAQVGLCFPAWPMASGHWIAAFFIALILFGLASPGWRTRRQLVLLGVASGCLIGVQHHKGIPVVLGVCLIIAVSSGLDRHFGTSPDGAPRSGALRDLLAPYLGGVSAVVGVMLFALVLQGSAGELLGQLVIEPFTGYQAVNDPMPWAAVERFTRGLARNTVVPVLRSLPALIPIGLARGFLAWRRRDEDRVRKLQILVLYSSVCALSVLYRADFIHVAFVVAPFFVLLAETIQAAVRAAARAASAPSWSGRGFEVGIAFVLLISIGAGLHRFVDQWRERYPYSADTAFGRVDFRQPHEVELVRAVRGELEAHTVREIFCYPAFASMYLLAGGSNPTRYDLVFPGQHGAGDYEEIISVLEEQSTRTVVTGGFLKPGDRFMQYVSKRFDCVRTTSNGRGCRLFRRKGAATPR